MPGCSVLGSVISRVAIVVILAAVALFAWIAHEVREGNHAEFEAAVLKSLRPEGRPMGPAGMDNAIRDVTALGSATAIVSAALMAIGYLLIRGERRVALIFVVAIAGGELLNTALKNSFDRARPEAVERLVDVHSYSFPSGHAMGASIFYLTGAALLGRSLLRRRERYYLLGCSIVLIGAIGFSRVYLGVHYPTDVLAGWAAGTAWATLCWELAGLAGARAGKSCG